MQIRALVLSMAAVMGVGGANAQTASVNFDTPALAVAPQSAVLSNGVTWSVNAGGPWDLITGTLAGGIPYAHYNVGATRVQTWTFSEPVNLAFSIAGLNCASEGILFSEGTQATNISLDHAWDSATRIIRNGGLVAQSKGASTSSFQLLNTTTLVLDTRGMADVGCRRGLTSLQVTPVPKPVPEPEPPIPVPVDNPLGLAALALGLLAGAARRVWRVR